MKNSFKLFSLWRLSVRLSLIAAIRADGVHRHASAADISLYHPEDSLPVQLHDTMLPSKQPVSIREDSLLTIMNHMPTLKSTRSLKINGCYVQVLENIQVSY